jgi:signal transduction histidine kinase
MLSGLLIQWLRSQWQSEKEYFQKDINRIFVECVNQVMDSMLVKHVIVPVLDDTSEIKDHLYNYNKRQLPANENSVRHVTAFYNNAESPKQTTVTITLPDTVKDIHSGNVTFGAIDSAEKKMLLRSVKLIIKRTGDSTGKLNRFDHLISAIPDTTLLKRLFENKVGLEEARFKISWTSDSLKGNNTVRGPVMYLKTNLFEKPLNAEILNYRGVILRSISVQIMFALALLIVTGAAFFFTFRNLKKQEALNDLRNDFVSNISHELKTPVSTVSIALEALKNFDRKKDSAKSDEYLEIAYSEMQRLDQLITQVLDTSVLEKQGDYLKTEKADLVSLTRNVLNSMQVRFKQTGAAVAFSSQPEEIFLDFDKLHIRGVLINLLDNSLKYCQGKPEIEIRIEDMQSCAILTVGDNGPGIPEEYISRIFEKFFRVPKGNIHDIKGYGLGLSFADHVMRHHSGSISVRNKDKGGCVFTLTFPKIKL